MSKHIEDYFTPHAQLVLKLALGEAKQLGHSLLSSEHLLLGLLFESEGIAGQVLRQLGMQPEAIRSRLASLQPENPNPAPSDINNLSPDLKRVLRLSAKQARHRQMGAKIDTEHLLLGLVRSQSNIFSRLAGRTHRTVSAIFEECDISYSQTLRQIRRESRRNKKE